VANNHRTRTSPIRQFARPGVLFFAAPDSEAFVGHHFSLAATHNKLPSPVRPPSWPPIFTRPPPLHSPSCSQPVSPCARRVALTSYPVFGHPRSSPPLFESPSQPQPASTSRGVSGSKTLVLDHVLLLPSIHTVVSLKFPCSSNIHLAPHSPFLFSTLSLCSPLILRYPADPGLRPDFQSHSVCYSCHFAPAPALCPQRTCTVRSPLPFPHRARQ